MGTCSSRSSVSEADVDFEGLAVARQRLSSLALEERDMDMTQPLAKYFISSSHNTYLQGDQVQSESTPLAVARALRLGVRVVELDVWDSPTGVVVTHGGTFTSKCAFAAFVKAIRDHAFVASEYPVIVTLENHCKLKGQQAMAATLRRVFKDKLFVPSEEETSLTMTPANLKGKILIRDKIRGGKKRPNPRDDDQEEEEDDDEEDEEHEDARRKRLGPLEALVAIRNEKNTLSHLNFEQHGHVASSSWSEKKLAKNATEALTTWCETKLARIYPSGLRIDSSNYDPTRAWAMGCQIVALNFQSKTPSKARPLWLSQAKFLANGGAGYVLKTTAPPGAAPALITVSLFGARGWTGGWGAYEKFPDVYATVSVACRDIESKSTKHVDDSTEPEWNATFEFHVDDVNLTLLLVEFWDFDAATGDDFLGHVALPVTDLRKNTKLTLPLLGPDLRLWDKGGDPVCDLLVDVQLLHHHTDESNEGTSLCVEKTFEKGHHRE